MQLLKYLQASNNAFGWIVNPTGSANLIILTLVATTKVKGQGVWFVNDFCLYHAKRRCISNHYFVRH